MIAQLAPGFYRISLLGSDFLNLYLLEDVLVDSGFRFSKKRLISNLKGHSIQAHALTHAHFDHQGCSHLICESYNIPLWCGEGDRLAVETGDTKSIIPPSQKNLTLIDKLLEGPPHPVSRVLHDADIVGGFRVLEVPGHTPGHLAFWRESDRILVLGDVIFRRNPMTFRLGLSEPPAFICFDKQRNRQSIKSLGSLEPALVCFGHGPELRDTRQFNHFIASLPAL